MLFLSHFCARLIATLERVDDGRGEHRAKTEKAKTVVGKMDVSLGVGDALRCHTREDTRMRWAIVDRALLGLGKNTKSKWPKYNVKYKECPYVGLYVDTY